MHATGLKTLPNRRPVIRAEPDDVLRTCRRVTELIRSDATNPWVVEAARMAVADAVLDGNTDDSYERQRYACVLAVWRWVKRNIAYVHDPHDQRRFTEFLCDSENLLRMRAGDCDEHTVLTGAMLASLGFHPVVPIIGGIGNEPLHICPIVQIPGWRSDFVVDGRPMTFVDTTIDRPMGARAGNGHWTWWQYQYPRSA